MTQHFIQRRLTTKAEQRDWRAIGRTVGEELLAELAKNGLQASVAPALPPPSEVVGGYLSQPFRILFTWVPDWSPNIDAGHYVVRVDTCCVDATSQEPEPMTRTVWYVPSEDRCWEPSGDPRADAAVIEAHHDAIEVTSGEEPTRDEGEGNAPMTIPADLRLELNDGTIRLLSGHRFVDLPYDAGLIRLFDGRSVAWATLCQEFLGPALAELTRNDAAPTADAPSPEQDR